jgi:hypothetical protein
MREIRPSGSEGGGSPGEMRARLGLKNAGKTEVRKVRRQSRRKSGKPRNQRRLALPGGCEFDYGSDGGYNRILLGAIEVLSVPPLRT